MIKQVLSGLMSRVLASCVVMFGISILIFTMARVIPGDPARIALGPLATESQIQAMRTSRHLNDPIIVQYGFFLRDLSHGDLGHSFYTNRPVVVDIKQFFSATFELVLFAGLLMIVIGLPLGIVSAHLRGRLGDDLARLVALLGVCTPPFVWAVILQLCFAYFIPIFPLEGRLSFNQRTPEFYTGLYVIDSLLSADWSILRESMYHLVLPGTALALAAIGQTARITRSNMVEIYGRPYIEMARAYGFSPLTIAMRYAFRPAFIPTLTILGLDFAALLGNAFLVEKVFVWSGVSRYGVEVILRKDLDAIVGTVLIIAAIFLVANIVIDILVLYVNPRIRLTETYKEQ